MLCRFLRFLGLLYIACLEGILVPLYEPKYCFNFSVFCRVLMIKKCSHIHGLFAVLGRKQRLLKESPLAHPFHAHSSQDLCSSVCFCASSVSGIILTVCRSLCTLLHCMIQFLLLICRVAIGGPQSMLNSKCQQPDSKGVLLQF